MPDAHKNFAYSTVATAPSPASSGTSLVVQSGDGAKFPTVPFNATIWPVSSLPTTANAEIVRVTTISTDTLTITRAQESSSARSVIVGDQIAATITAKTLTDVEAQAIFPMASGRYFCPYTFSQSSSNTDGGSNNVLMVAPGWLPQAGTLDRIACYVANAGATGAALRLGLYQWNGGYPGSLILDAGSIAVGTGTGWQESTISKVVAPGPVWVALAWQGTPASRPNMVGIGSSNITPNFSFTSTPPSNSGVQNGFAATGQSGAFPDPFPAAQPSQAGMAVVWVRYA